MPTLPSTSIAIVTHRRPDALRDMLASLAAARFPPSVTQALVIENGDPDCGSRDVAAAAALPLAVRWHHLADSRVSVSRNFGVAEAGGDFVVIYDDDVRIGAEALTAYVAAAAEFGPGHFFGGPIVPRQDVAPPEWLSAYLPASARGWTLGAERRIVDAPVFLGANLAAFRSDILAAGGFPEYLGTGQDYVVGGEETCLQQRMLDQGMKGVFVPDAVVQHHVPAERCTPAFALDRYFSYLVTSEIARHVEKDISPSRLPPRWVWRQFLTSYVKALWRRLGMRDEQARFGADLDLCAPRAQFAARAIMARHHLYDRYGRSAPKRARHEH